MTDDESDTPRGKPRGMSLKFKRKTKGRGVR
jgi:hypothetical protein